MAARESHLVGQQAAKRTLDLVLSGLLTILFAPSLLTLSTLQMLDLLIFIKMVRVVLACIGN